MLFYFDHIIKIEVGIEAWGYYPENIAVRFWYEKKKPFDRFKTINSSKIEILNVLNDADSPRAVWYKLILKFFKSVYIS